VSEQVNRMDRRQASRGLALADRGPDRIDDTASRILLPLSSPRFSYETDFIEVRSIKQLSILGSRYAGTFHEGEAFRSQQPVPSANRKTLLVRRN
jgi:hypothetical protein